MAVLNQSLSVNS